MDHFSWNIQKNKKLVRERKVSFDEVAASIRQGHLLDLIENPNQRRYRGQEVFIVAIRGYAYMVPFERHGDQTFLITIIPSRKMTRKYLHRNGGGNGQAK